MSNETISSETIEQILNQVLTNGTRLEEISDRLTELAGRLDAELEPQTANTESAADPSEANQFDALDADQRESSQFLEDLKMQDSVDASEFADSFDDSEEAPLDSAQSLLDSLVNDDDSGESENPEVEAAEFSTDDDFEEDLANSNDTSLDELNAVFGDTTSTFSTEDETETTEAEAESCELDSLTETTDAEESETYEVDSSDETDEGVAAESFLDSSTDETLFSEQTADELSNNSENGDDNATEESPEESPEVSKSVESVRSMLAGLMNGTDDDVPNEESSASDAAAIVEATVVTDNSDSESEEGQASDSDGVASFLEKFTSEAEAVSDEQDSQTVVDGGENSADDVATVEASNVEALRKELEDKLRKAEIEMSIERARISQKAAELEEKQLVLEQKERSIQNGPGELSEDGGTTESRWNRHMSASRKKDD